MIYIIIAGFLALSLFFHSALDAETNITMIYKQLGWIAVILLLLTGEVCEKSKKIINTLNENNKIIDKSTYTQTFTETQEDAQQEEEKERIKAEKARIEAEKARAILEQKKQVYYNKLQESLLQK